MSIAKQIQGITLGYSAEILKESSDGKSAINEPVFEVPFYLSLALRTPLVQVHKDSVSVLVYSPRNMCVVFFDEQANNFAIFPVEFTDTTDEYEKISFAIDDENNNSILTIDVEFESFGRANALVCIDGSAWLVHIVGEEWPNE